MNTVIDAPTKADIPTPSVTHKIQHSGGTDGEITIGSYTPVTGADLQFSTDGGTN